MSAPAGLRRFLQHAVAAARSAARAATQKGRRGGRDGRRPTGGPGSSAGYPGDFTGAPQISYTPVEDGEPDPGEVVWTWVPFEDDPTLGKDRPVVIIGRHGADLAAVALTSKGKERGDYVDVGTGEWDRRHRPSFAKVDRLLDVDPSQVRREGAILNRRQFDDVIEAVRRYHEVVRV